MNQNQYFMRAPNPRSRAPMNSPSHRGMHMMQTNHMYGKVPINSGPVNRYPINPNPYPHCQDGRPQQQLFTGNHFSRPYFGHVNKKQWNSGSPSVVCSRFAHPPITPNNVGGASFSSEGIDNGRRGPFNHDRGSISRHTYPQPQYVLRTCIEPREECQARRISRHFTEVRASVNLTIRSGSYDYHIMGSRDKAFTARRGTGMEMVTLQRVPQTQVHIGKNSKDSGRDGTENAVEIKGEFAVAVGSCDPCTSHSSQGSEEDEEIVLTPLEEEYQPENPDIKAAFKPLTYKDISWCASMSPVVGEIDSSTTEQSRMATYDDEGFHEAFVGVCISRYPFGLGRMIEVAGYGVWFSDGHKCKNFSGVLKSSRPQNVKAIMIHGSARTVETMKNSGYSRVRINLETDYLNKNVLGWISKYMENPKAQPSNWDEVKYHPEILELCNSATGMVIKWSHCNETSVKKSGIEKATHLAKKATDAWMKDLLLRQEAVGTSQ